MSNRLTVDMVLRCVKSVNYQRKYPAIKAGEVGFTFGYSYDREKWIGIMIDGNQGPVHGGYGIGPEGRELPDHWEFVAWR